MEKFVEKLPTWSLPYLVNDDPSGLTEEDINQADDWCKKNNVQVVCPIDDSVEAEMQPYFTPSPAFGLPCDVIDCIVLCNI
jgi:hypothetical protein